MWPMTAGCLHSPVGIFMFIDARRRDGLGLSSGAKCIEVGGSGGANENVVFGGVISRLYFHYYSPALAYHFII